jgi:hypothetical protein
VSSTQQAIVTAAVALCLTAACSKKREVPKALPSSVPSVKPVDRLAPGELAAGNSQVFGFEIPSGMKVKGAFLEVAYLEGEVTPEALANYVRERVEVHHVEIGVGRTLFPSAHIKRGLPDRVYDLEVAPDNGTITELTIRDVTPRPSLPPGTTEADRWRAAGRSPDGKPIDINELR